MKLFFTKMQGLGNDFLVLDNTQNNIVLSSAQIQFLADRRLGIGFDQLLMLEPHRNSDHDFYYRIFNADGSEVGQCGNGARCITRYIIDKRLSNKTNFVLQTLTTQIETKYENNNLISVSLGIPKLHPKDIPFLHEVTQKAYQLEISGKKYNLGALSVGNPHAVLIVDDIATAPVETLGATLMNHSAFPEKVNVGFMQIIDRKHIKLRVYERGAGETRACGSGACAAVVSGHFRGLLAENVRVELPGGSLEVFWRGITHEVWMTGPAERVFEGEIVLT